MTFEQKKARAIALMDSKKMWRSNYAPPLLRILWRLGIRLPPLPFMPFWQVTVLTGGLWGISWGCVMWFTYWGPSGKLTGCHHGMMCKPCTGVFLRSGTFIYLYANLYSCVMTGLQPLRHFQRIALPAYHPAFFIP
ncbi:DUF6404 family protein [Escherichia coli]|uniref:DUF6404 family protein n=2 Tax=Escherichia coli TaxID=562 RepID=UPI0031F2E91C